MSKLQRILLGAFGVFGIGWAAIMAYAEYPENQFDAWVMLFLGYTLVRIAIADPTPTNKKAGI